MIALWLSGLIRARWGRLLGAMSGVASTVALIAALGVFLQTSSASMTARAITSVPVDWQIQLALGASLDAVRDAAAKATPLSKVQAVDYAAVGGFEAATGGTVQTTGAGQVLGLGPSYASLYPGQIRLLLGRLDGVLVAQQTAANLHVSLGDTVVIYRPGLPSADVSVSGIVDLPNANSLFQAVGVPKGFAPQAPPDNVLIVPASLWAELFAARRWRLGRTACAGSCTSALTAPSCQATPERPPGPQRRPAGAWKLAWRAARFWRTISQRASTLPAGTRSTPRSCSYSSARRAQPWRRS